jgi:hypothetical protein
VTRRQEVKLSLQGLICSSAHIIINTTSRKQSQHEECEGEVEDEQLAIYLKETRKNNKTIMTLNI